MPKKIKKILFTEEKVQEKANELASLITKDFNGEELVCIGVLRGSIIWFSDLVKKIDLPIQFDFIRVSSYNGSESSENIDIHQGTHIDLKGKNVLIIEDIIDTGLTLSFVVKEFEKSGAKNIKTCALIDKKERRKVDIKADYIGFEIPDFFIVGYGMDYDDNYRGLNYIGVIE